MNRYFTKRKAKKAPVQPKFELDLTSVLPSDDNFRTSLIMTSLSRRFSMLREQDDPRSLLGKASDDSVLAPRRQSRLMDFGYSPGRSLHDIAEVSSINSDFRPPFAASQRGDSFISDNGYGTDDESNNGGMMSRSRPGEGNVLFGGRQKIYKIPMAGAASDSNLGAAPGLKGRALYDDDVMPSTFQRWRQEERDRLAREKEQNPEQDSPSRGPLSPLYNGSITRQTSTSTSNTSAQSYGRTSTAATSVASQIGALYATTSAYITNSAATSTSSMTNSPALDRSLTKNRRLYDQGLNREIEEQQSTAMTRLNSIQRVKGRVSPPFARSASRQGTADTLRSASPSPGSIAPLSQLNTSFPLADKSIPEHSPHSPISPLDPFKNNTLMSALNPGDRGKATAMGAFNKPQQFNEKQYMERQLTLRNGVDRHIPKPESLKKEEPKVSMDGDRSDEQSSYTQSTFSGRSRAPTNASTQDVTPSPFSMFQNAASLIKSPPLKKEDDQDEHKTNFFFNRSSSGSEYENESSFTPPPFATPKGNRNNSRVPPNKPLTQPPAHQHPAFKSGARLNGDMPRPSAGPTSAPNDFIHFDFTDGAEEHPPSSNTLGVTNGGLSGLVRQHLRHGSNASSFYEQDAPNGPTFPTQLALKTRDMSPAPGMKTSETATPAESSYSHGSNPFDLEDLKHTASQEVGRYSPISPVDDDIAPLDTSPKGIKATRRRGMSQLPEPSEEIPWQAEMKKSHARGPSAETIQEQDALSNEIAKRQRAIQERLRAKQLENEVANASPTTEERTASGPFRGFDMLRTKSSRESIKKAADSIASSKPGRALGLSGGSERPSYDRWRTDESSYTPSSMRSRSTSRPSASRSNSRPPTSRSGTQKPYGLPTAPDATRQISDSRRTSDENGPNRDRKNSNPPPISALNNTNRSRSNSVQSNDRSRSRNGRYKDDLEKAMIEGTSSRVTTQLYQEPPTIPEHYQAPRMPSMEKQRYPSDSQQPSNLKIQTARSPMMPGGYFESKGLYPPQPLQSPLSASSATSSPRLPIQSNAVMSSTHSPRPSPGFPLSPAIGISSARASPVPFASNGNMATPPMSGNSTPIAHSFPSNPPPNSMTNRGRSASRKRSIQKSDIGEPRLISTTSVIDTVDLPAGASLKNGMDDFQNSAPPLPAMNPLRRKFGLSRTSEDGRESPAFRSQPYEPLGSGSYMYANNEGSSFKPRHRLRKSSSEGEKLGMRLRAQQQATASNPALVVPGGRGMIEGGMF
jgi:hypothetical protein